MGDADDSITCISHLGDGALAPILRKAICRCIGSCKEASPLVACRALNRVFGCVSTCQTASEDDGETNKRELEEKKEDDAKEAECQELDGPAAKRRRIQRFMASTKVKDGNVLLGEAAVEWCTKFADEGRITSLCSCAMWRQLHPAAFLKVVKAVKEPAAVSHAVTRWVDGADAIAVFEAISLGDVKRDNVDQMVRDAAKRRLIETERQNAAFGGGKFRDEVDAAVEAAKAITDTMMRKEFEANEGMLRKEFETTEAELRAQLAEERRLRMEDARGHQSKVEGLRKSLKRVLDAIEE